MPYGKYVPPEDSDKSPTLEENAARVRRHLKGGSSGETSSFYDEAKRIEASIAKGKKGASRG
jgi:hypothetical protein